MVKYVEFVARMRGGWEVRVAIQVSAGQVRQYLFHPDLRRWVFIGTRKSESYSGVRDAVVQAIRCGNMTLWDRAADEIHANSGKDFDDLSDSEQRAALTRLIEGVERVRVLTLSGITAQVAA